MSTNVHIRPLCLRYYRKINVNKILQGFRSSFSEKDFREDNTFGESDFGEKRTTRTLNHRNSIFEIINRDLFRERFQKFKFLIINFIFK